MTQMGEIFGENVGFSPDYLESDHLARLSFSGL